MIDIEYTALVETSQTHRRSVHHEYYVKKKRILEDAEIIPIAYEKVMEGCPTLEIDPNRYDEIISESAIDPLSLSIEENNLVSIRTYGIARDDIGIKGKRFPWLDEEIEYFHYYIREIEPTLNEQERCTKYATCLAHIKAADDDIIKFFHPHHLENSDRIKTGYLKALELLNNSSR